MREIERKIADVVARVEKPYYSSDREKYTFGLPATSTVVAVGGYRLIIRHAEGMLLSITPKAASAGRGHIILDPWGSADDMYRVKIGDYYYMQDPCGPVKLHAALALALSAWEVSEGQEEGLYKALGQTGNCAICGALLTDELSMSRGIGPECYRKIGVGKDAAKEVQRRRVKK